METRRRSLAKALTWRFFATIITVIIAFVITGEVAVAAEIGVLDTVMKFIMYFGHERMWSGVRYGRIET